MKVTWINHASFLIQDDALSFSLLTDPWYSGRVFLDGWELLAETRGLPLDVHGRFFVWISHEHPDHFSPNTLREIIKTYPDVQFLYQTSLDKRVVTWITRSGGSAIELPNGKKVRLVDGPSVLCRRLGSGDSYLIAESDGETFVNTNDAVLFKSDIKTIQRDCKEFHAVDYLTCQFGIAGKVGNINDIEMRVEESSKIVSLVLSQVIKLGAKHYIPSASMKVFCRQDNCYMNRGQTNLRSLVEMLLTETNCLPLVLPSNERWDRTLPIPNWQLLVDQFDSAIREQSEKADGSSDREVFSLEEVRDAYMSWWNRQVKFHSRLGLFLVTLVSGSIGSPGLCFMVDEIEELVGIRSAPTRDHQRKKEKLVIEVRSDVVLKALSEDYGLMSLLISARFQASAQAQRCLRILAWIAIQRSSERRINLRFLGRQTLRAGRFFLVRRFSL